MMCEADLCRVLLPRLSIDLHWGRVQKLYLHLINKHVCAIGGVPHIWRMQFCQKDLSPSLTSVACPTRCGSLRPTWKFHATWCEQRVLDKVSNSHYDTVGSALKHFLRVAEEMDLSPSLGGDPSPTPPTTSSSNIAV